VTDLDELRQVLRAREALAPDPAGIAAAARARGTRIRRTRRLGALAGTAIAVVAVVAVSAALVTRPQAARQQPGGDGAVSGGWPATPSYTGPAVPGQPAVPGPTGGPGQPASGRPIDPVVPYQVRLPDGWRETDVRYEEGSFRGSYLGPGNNNTHICAIDVLDPATQPASLLHPSGDPATGQPGPDGTLAWRADERHFVRVQVQNDPAPDLFRSIAATIDFDQQRQMTSPFALGYLPPGLHLSGVDIGIDTTPDGGGGPWWDVALWFDTGTGATRTDHDLLIGASGDDRPADPSTAPTGTPTTVAGHSASYNRYSNALDLTVFGVQGQTVLLAIGKAAQDRITLDEAARIVNGVRFVQHPADPTTWTPLHIP
jgi:hypothetical protein